MIRSWLAWVTYDDVNRMNDEEFADIWMAYALIAKARARRWAVMRETEGSLA